MEDEVPGQTLCMEGTNRGMMGYLLWYQPEALFLSVQKWKKKTNSPTRLCGWVEGGVVVIPDELVGLSQQRVEWLSSPVPLGSHCWHSKGSYCLKIIRHHTSHILCDILYKACHIPDVCQLTHYPRTSTSWPEWVLHVNSTQLHSNQKKCTRDENIFHQNENKFSMLLDYVKVRTNEICFVYIVFAL